MAGHKVLPNLIRAITTHGRQNNDSPEPMNITFHSKRDFVAVIKSTNIEIGRLFWIIQIGSN
jgi:hypothetical protein